VATVAKSSFDIDIRRASHFLDIHQQVHAGTHGAPVLALRELPRGALVFAVGALDAYLSDVSAEVMIHQCRHGSVTGDTRAEMMSRPDSHRTVREESRILGNRSASSTHADPF